MRRLRVNDERVANRLSQRDNGREELEERLPADRTEIPTLERVLAELVSGRLLDAKRHDQTARSLRFAGELEPAGRAARVPSPAAGFATSHRSL